MMSIAPVSFFSLAGSSPGKGTLADIDTLHGGVITKRLRFPHKCWVLFCFGQPGSEYCRDLGLLLSSDCVGDFDTVL